MKNKIEELIKDITFFDTETTGVDTDHDDIIEMCLSNSEFTYVSKFNTDKEIPPEASAVHYITKNDIKDLEYYKDSAELMMQALNSTKYIVAHNLSFDAHMTYNNTKRSLGDSAECLKLKDVNRRICTLELAKKLYAEDENFKNLTLGYLWFKLKVNEDHPNIKITPHQAEDDVLMCKLVFIKLVQTIIDNGMVDINNDLGAELVHLCQKPTRYQKMPWGKHKSELISNVPSSYLKWLIENSEILDSTKPNFDKDFAFTVEDEITMRIEKGTF